MAKSLWERRLDEHACWARLSHAAEVLAELHVDDVDGDADQQLARARRAVALVQEMKSDADALWVGVDTMDSIEAAAASLVTAADQFSSTDNEAHLSQLSDPSDSLVRAARHLVPPESPAVTRILSQEVEQGRQAVSLLQDEFSRARVEAEEQEAATRARLSETADTLEQRLTETKAALESTKQEIDALTTEDREQRAARFKAQMEEQESKLKERLAALESEFQERMNSAQESADEVLAEVKRRREEVENEAGAVAISALGGRLGQTADREDSRALWWTVTSILIALLVVPALLLFDRIDGGDGSLERAAVAVALVSASGYAARAAGRHRSQAEHYREQENRMKTLLPFTANLEDSEATALKVLAGLDVFVPETKEDRTSDGPAPRHYLEGVLADRIKRRINGDSEV